MSIKERYLALEDTLLDMIASCVKIDENAQEAETDPEKWKVKKISESENLKQEAKKEIKKQLAEVPEELEAEMEAAADRETARTAEQFQQAVKDGLKLPVATAVTKALRQTAKMVTGGQVSDDTFKDQPDLDPLKAAMEFFYGQTRDRLNLTAATMLKSVKHEYCNLIYSTAEQLVDGEKTYQEAMRSCITRLANNNLTAFTDKVGREWSPEAYVSMLLKTANKNVTNLTSFANMDRYGYDLAQVSNHAGARPKCYPYQGKLVSKSGKSGTCEDGNGNRVQYVGLGDTSYGQPDGLLGINCGHYLFPFMPGVSTITSEVQSKGENDLAYKQSQKQRELERAVRKAKREKSMAENANDAEGAKTAAEKVKQGQKKLREFINESGRTRRYDREQVFTGFDRIKNDLRGRSPYNGEILDIDDKVLQKISKAESMFKAISDDVFGDVDIFKNATEGEIFSVEMIPVFDGKQYILRKGFNFGIASSDISLIENEIKAGIDRGFYFPGTTPETLFIHEGVHSFLYTYAMNKAGLEIGKPVTDATWDKMRYILRDINNDFVNEAASLFPDDFINLKKEIGGYPFSRPSIDEINQEIIAQSIAKSLTVGSENKVIKYITDNLKELK